MLKYQIKDKQQTDSVIKEKAQKEIEHLKNNLNNVEFRIKDLSMEN